MSSYSSTYPAIRPTYQIDFSNGKRIPPNATFSRADTASSGSWSPFTNTPTLSNGTPGTTNQYYLISINSTADLGAGVQSWTAGKYIQWNGTVWAQVDQPIGVTYWSNEKSLSSENLLLQSENFHTTWTVADAGRTAGVTAPNGSSSASTLTSNTGSTNAPRVNQSLSGKLSTNTQYTMVGHVKAGTATHGYISFRGTNSNNYAYAQIEFASPGSVSTGGVGFTSISGTVTALGSSWYRLTLTATTGSDVSGAFAFLGVNDGTAFGISGYPVWSTAGETLEIWGAQISSTNTKVYDSPTTTQISRSYAPTLKYVTPSTGGMARFEYDPTDGQSAGTSLGCLIESQATSLISYSESFSNQTVNSCSLTEGAAVGPTGTLNANLLVPTASGTVVRNLNLDDGNAISHTSGNNYAYSIFAKAAGYNYLQWVGGAYFGYTYCNFDLTNGTVGGKSGSVTGSVESVGNGWYRLTVVAPATSTNNTTSKGIWGVVTSSTAARNEQFTGDAYSGVLLTMAQCELGSHSSSYIASDSGAAAGTTRAADSMSVATADIPGFSEGVGTIVCETGGVASSTVGNQLAFGLNGPASSNQFSAGVNAGGLADSTVRVYSQTPAGDQAFLNPGTATVGTGYKLACRYELDNIAASMNGGTVVSDTSGQVPVGIDTLWIGELEGNYHINSNIKRIAVFNEALSDTNLISLTS